MGPSLTDSAVQQAGAATLPPAGPLVPTITTSS